MQNCYGMVIRNNVDDIHNMRKATGAVLYHCTDFKNQDYRHSICPNDENSWCKYQLDKVNGIQKYKDTINIPVNILGRRTLEMGVNSAILNFNDGSKGLLYVLNYFDLSEAVMINKGVKRDTSRVKQSIRKSSERDKKRRKTLRSMKKGYLDKEKEKEKSESYVLGGF